MLKHQYNTLIEYLRLQPNSKEEVWQKLIAHKNFDGLRLISFMKQSDFDRFHPKMKPKNIKILTDEEANNFPGGIPGFPNKLKREWFDKAWEDK